MKKNILLKITYVSLLCSLLSACSTVSTQPANSAELSSTSPILTWPARQTQLAKLTAWNLQGAIGLQQENRRWNASINWQQDQAAYYRIRLYGPLGTGAMQLENQPGKAIFKSNDHPEPITATNAQTLIAKATGWQLPVEDLYYWIRGLPAPSTPTKMILDKVNQLQTLQQDGWQIQYLDYATVKGITLPDKILLNNTSFKIKLVIKQWQIG